MNLLHLQDQPALSKQLALLKRLTATLESEASCLGAAVGGSLATDRADHMSDVDLLVYCEKGSAAALLSRLSHVAQTLPVVHRMTGKHDDCGVYEKVVLEDWSSYEIHVVEPGTRMRLKPPYLELLNRDNYLAQRVSVDKPIGRDTVRPYGNGDEGLFWELFNCLKWLRRGEVDFTSQYLQRLALQLAQRTDPE